MKCCFETERLRVGNLESTDAVFESISHMMTAPVTNSLPPSWQGEYSPDRAKSWSAECAEGGTTVLSISSKSDVAPSLIGLVILFAEVREEDLDSSAVDLRLGYLLSEQAWGQGFASEVVAGLVRWCRDSGRSSSAPGPADGLRPVVKRVLGGVALDNPASKRVLLKSGFKLLKEEEREEIFELQL